jgi:predicted MFS family arabinose efflux permease
VQGYLIAAGGLGAASSTLPVRLLLHYTDWRWLLVMLAAACLATALLVLLVAPTPPATAPRPVSRQVLLEICRNPSFRQTATLVLVPHAVFFGVQGLWIGRWLADVARFDEAAIAWLLYLGMAAVIFGAIAVGMLTEWTARRGIAPLRVAAVGVALFVLVQCGFVLDWQPSYPLLAVLFTLVGTITAIEYSIVAQSMPAALMGRAATILNLLIFIGAFLVQAGFGAVVSCWQAAPGAPAYRCAFALLVLLQLPGLLHYLWRRRAQ